MASNEGNNSTHDEIASKIRPRIDKDSRKSMAELLAKGFIIFADISCEDENMACICYVENNTTKAQHDRLQEIKNNCNYEYIPDANSLEDVLEQLKEKAIEDGMPEDFFSIDLLDAYEHLGFITGESVGEDLVNEIFAEFCMGK